MSDEVPGGLHNSWTEGRMTEQKRVKKNEDQPSDI